MSIYLGIHRIVLFWYEQFRQIYLVERICICICIWIDVFVFVFVFVFESKLNKIFVFVFEKFKFLYLYLYLIKRIWPQPWRTHVEIMKFLVLPFLDKILSNIFVYMNILAIITQQVRSNKTLLVWSIWPNLSQTLHKTPCYGPGSELWRANGRGLYLAPTTKFPTWCVSRVSVGPHTDSFMKEVCGLPQGCFTTRGKSVK